jgi:ABC-type uncharacterized transport system substrate-binding protein
MEGRTPPHRGFAVSAGMVLLGACLLTSCAASGQSRAVLDQTPADVVEVPDRTFKVLHVMSYHADWAWNVDQFDGFKDALHGLDVEYRVVEMDTKHRSSPAWMEQVGRETRELIDTWQPDLVYTNDDDAQEHVTRYYVNADMPFVFSAVNADPETYGFVEATNVTGVLEREHFVETVHLLKEVAPDVREVAVIVDDDAMWDPVVARMQEQQELLPEVTFVSWDVILTFEEYKQRMTELQETADAVGLIGIFHFKDAHGENVDYRDVLKWTAENSSLPDFTFWRDRISYGTLCAVTVSGYEQGLAAGNMARGILVGGRSPSSYAIEPSARGEPVVSLARARELGISLTSDTLLASDVVQEFAWQE